MIIGWTGYKMVECRKQIKVTPEIIADLHEELLYHGYDVKVTEEFIEDCLFQNNTKDENAAYFVNSYFNFMFDEVNDIAYFPDDPAHTVYVNTSIYAR